MKMRNVSEEKIQQVWEKAEIVDNEDKDDWRKDACGAWIKRNQYEQETDHSWEIDHIKPVSKDGSDDLKNLMPLHRENSRTKGDDYPNFKSSVTSEGNKNIQKELPWEITLT